MGHSTLVFRQLTSLKVRDFATLETAAFGKLKAYPTLKHLDRAGENSTPRSLKRMKSEAIGGKNRFGTELSGSGTPVLCGKEQKYVPTCVAEFVRIQAHSEFVRI